MKSKIKKLFSHSPKTRQKKEKLDGIEITWKELPEPIKKKVSRFFALRPIIIVTIVSLLIGAFAGAVASIYASTYIFSKFFPYSSMGIVRPLEKEPQIGEVGLTPGPVFGTEESIISAVEKVSPSVVSIVVSEYVTRYYGPVEEMFPEDFFDDWFWGPRIPERWGPSVPEEKKEKQEVGGGTGFVISTKDRLILTNKHVVANEKADYTVVTNDGQEFEAEVLTRDPFNDIAVLKIKDEKFDLGEVILGDSDKLQIGQTVIAIGNALGEYRNTVTKGVISGIGRRIIAGDVAGQSEVLENVIQTDAAINFGNSGGPLINLKGEVIGINTAISHQGQLIGFAIPINQATQAIESVKKYGKIIRPFLGVRYVLLNKAIAKKNNLSVDYGALIVRGTEPGDLAIIPGGPADKAGLVENDIILEVNGVKITETSPLTKEIQKYTPGDEVELKILHKGEEKTIKVVLEEYKS